MLKQTTVYSCAYAWVIIILNALSCVLDSLDLRYTFPMIHWFAEHGETPGS